MAEETGSAQKPPHSVAAVRGNRPKKGEWWLHLETTTDEVVGLPMLPSVETVILTLSPAAQTKIGTRLR